jgi:hypothetical protein
MEFCVPLAGYLVCCHWQLARPSNLLSVILFSFVKLLNDIGVNKIAEIKHYQYSIP